MKSVVTASITAALWLTATHAVAQVCYEDRDCDDHLFCDGREYCLFPGTLIALCLSESASPCPAGAVCEEVVDACVLGCADGDADRDGDGHARLECGGDDCDDDDPLAHPGAPEICDSANRDEDCDPDTFGQRDGDGDGYPDARCCNGDGCGNDCDDSQPGVHPTEAESCDLRDNDCDGAVDEDISRIWYFDDDADGHGVASTTLSSCDHPEGYAPDGNDCDDTNPAIVPGAMQCVPNYPSLVRVCGSGGVWGPQVTCGTDVPMSMLTGQVCVAQPNGAGVCQLQSPQSDVVRPPGR